MSHLIATVSKIESCDSLNIVNFECKGQTLSMMSLDLVSAIKVGTKVKLLTQASHIAVAKEFSGDISYSNKFSCTLESMENGQLLSSLKLNFFGTIIESIITLNSSKRMNLKVGDKVKLIFEDGNEMVEVVSSSKGSFTVNSDKSGDVFVYGREVNDFHVVDYEAISMLNVSATQELFKLIQQLQKDNTALNSKLKEFTSMKSDIELLKEAVGIDAQTNN